MFRELFGLGEREVPASPPPLPTKPYSLAGFAEYMERAPDRTYYYDAPSDCAHARYAHSLGQHYDPPQFVAAMPLTIRDAFDEKCWGVVMHWLKRQPLKMQVEACAFMAPPDNEFRAHPTRTQGDAAKKARELMALS